MFFHFNIGSDLRALIIMAYGYDGIKSQKGSLNAGIS